MWAKARSLASKHLKPAFANLKNVSSDDPQTNMPEVSDAVAVIVSELAANVVRHTSSEFTVSIERSDAYF